MKIYKEFPIMKLLQQNRNIRPLIQGQGNQNCQHSHDVLSQLEGPQVKRYPHHRHRRRKDQNTTRPRRGNKPNRELPQGPEAEKEGLEISNDVHIQKGNGGRVQLNGMETDHGILTGGSIDSHLHLCNCHQHPPMDQIEGKRNPGHPSRAHLNPIQVLYKTQM